MMAPSALRSALRSALSQVLAESGVDPAHDLSHTDRVWVNARTIAMGEGIAPSHTLMAAAYLHDLVTMPKNHPDRSRASAMSATVAGPIMEALGFAAGDIAIARHSIESHSYSAGVEPMFAEAKILRDADRLEALGAVGIARCFAVAGDLKRQLFDAADPFARQRAADDQTYALDHFKVKLLKLPEGMLTATGRRLATERTVVMRRFLADLAQELLAPAPDW